MIGESLEDVLPEELWQRTAPDIRAVLEGESRSFEMPVSDGEAFYCVSLTPLREEGAVVGGVLNSHEVQQRLDAEVDLLNRTGSYEAAFTKAPIGMAMVALDGSLIRFNPAFCRLTGFSPDEMSRMKFQDMIEVKDHDKELALANRLFEGEIESYSTDKRLITKSGQLEWFLVAASLVRDETGTPVHLTVQIQDISAQRNLEAELRRVAGEDALTGLANRRRLELTLEDQIERCRRYGEVSGLLMVDLDNFKDINDTHGHSAGDRLLCFVAEQLIERVRVNDLVARPGGDEFAVVLVGSDASRAGKLADELMEHFDAVSFDLDGKPVSCRASIGSASINENTLTIDEVLSEADRSMYEIKSHRKSK